MSEREKGRERERERERERLRTNICIVFYTFFRQTEIEGEKAFMERVEFVFTFLSGRDVYTLHAHVYTHKLSYTQCKVIYVT